MGLVSVIIEDMAGKKYKAKMPDDVAIKRLDAIPIVV